MGPCFVVFAEEFRGAGPKTIPSHRIAVCWSGVVCEDQEQRSYLRRARVRVRMAG